MTLELDGGEQSVSSNNGVFSQHLLSGRLSQLIPCSGCGEAQIKLNDCQNQNLITQPTISDSSD